jgi:hypothetical protein
MAEQDKIIQICPAGPEEAGVQVWGLGESGKLYYLDQDGNWQFENNSPDLEK